MFYVNNDDMEEMFRQAAERYPLKTDGAADWEKVSAALKEEAGVSLADAGNYKKEKKRRLFFWWIILLPLGWIGHDSWQKLNNSGNENDKLSGQKQPAQLFLNQQVSDEPPPKKLAFNPSPDNAYDGFSSNKKNKIKPAIQNNLYLHKKNNQEKGELIKTYQTGTTNHPAPGDNAILNKEGIAANKNIVDDNVAGDQKKATTILKNESLKNSDAVLEKKPENDPAISGKRNDDVLKGNTGKPQEASLNKEESPFPATSANSSKQAKSPVAIKKSFHFYAGIIAGTDISTVKYQSVKGMGYSAGVLLGYHFTHSRFNIETGIYWDAKKYYTSGDYFNKKNIAYFNNPNVELNYVNGTCNMFEIPVNVRYNIKQTRNTSLFAVLGLSSYLMNKEAYGYGYTYNGNPEYGNYSYYHSTQNWFSIINLSVGFEHRIGKIGDIRIEPYAKLPLAGVGKGSLPITSGGLTVGLSRRF
jgi:outer membrane protein with beta-barrel domain